jgi:hypothetical protein
MKTKRIVILAMVCLMQPVLSFAQYTSKDQAEKNKTTQAGSLTEDKLVGQTSRNEDIKQFTNAMTMLSAAVEVGAQEEAKVMMHEILQIAGVEIARSQRNLEELEAGNNEHLEKWWAENKPTSKLNVKLEITNLKNRISHEQNLYGRLESWDLNSIKDSRDLSTLRGSLNSFKRDMERNLRFESDRKDAPPPPPKGGGTTVTKGNAQGGAAVIESVPSENPMIKSYNESKKIRKDEFKKGQAVFQKSMSSGDDKSAKNAFKSLVSVMMDEVNANSWMLNMINSGSIKDAGISVSELSATLKDQQALVEKATQLKSKASTDFSGVKSEMLSLVNSFGETL